MALNMPIEARKSDLRIIKTAKVLNTAMFILLERNNFGKITVRDICEEAQISRATFYARFADKYSFLKSWLITITPTGININEDYDKAHKLLNEFIYTNKAVIKNLICDADHETLEILAELACSIFDSPDEGGANLNQIVLCNFYAGGLIYYVHWLAKNRFPPEIEPINIHVLDIIKKFMEWMRVAA